MQNDKPKRERTAKTANKSTETPKGLEHPGDTSSKIAAYPPDVHRPVNTCDRHRPDWEEAGRNACRQGRKLTAYPYGATGLTAEGHIRAEAWILGWNKEALAIGGQRERATMALEPLSQPARVKTAGV